MPTGLLLPIPVFQITDSDNKPVSGGLLYSWLSGTSTPVSLYTDSGLTVAHPWPAVANTAGRVTAFGDRSVGYKIQACDADGVPLWDPVDGVILPPDIAPAVANSVPTGAILPYAGVTAPTGYLLCHGQTVSQTTYAALYAVIGDIYATSGEAETDFRLPDLRARYPVGKASSGTANTLGGVFGTLDHVHTGPSHTHTGTTDSSGDLGLSVDTPNSQNVSSGSGISALTEVDLMGDGAHSHTFTTAAGGTGNTGTANPPTLVLNWIVKT